MNSHALSRGLEILRVTHSVPAGVIERLARFISEAPEEALYRVAPLRLAGELQISDKQALDVLVYATHAGLFEFSWGIVCEGCTAFIETPAAIRALQRSKRCGLCQIDVPVDDDSLEVAFTVSQGVRTIRFHSPRVLDFIKDAPRMMFSPSSTALAFAEAKASELTLWSGRVGRGEVAEIPVNVPAGEYTILVPSLHAVTHLTAVEDGPQQVEVSLVDGDLFTATGQIAAGRPMTLRIGNEGEPVMVAFGRRPAFDPSGRPGMSRYITGKRLFTSQAFRELFRAESLPSPSGLAFKSMTVVFTDLKGSTALYDRIGDLRAWDLVRAHFDLLRKTIDDYGGAMVKTIGDAIMATFAEPLPAFEAATRMSREIRRVGDGELELKVGLHLGPCIAVELNQQLDYFGQTVNVASRVQGLADGGEIVCTEPIWETPGVRERANQSQMTAMPDRALLKGVAGEVSFHRLRQ